MKAAKPDSIFSLWRSEKLYNIDLVSYSLSHHSFPRHFHDHYVIELVVSGADKFYCDGKTYTAETGQLVLINPGEVHTGNTIADKPLHYYSLCPTMATMQQIAAALDIQLPSDFKFRQTLINQPGLAVKLEALFQSLEIREETLKQEELFAEFMTGLFSHALTKKVSGKTGQKDARVSLLTAYMRTHFKECITLDHMASLVNLNVFHLVRLFKKKTGLSPYTYLLNLRTEYARTLLRKGFKVNDAAIAAGFYDSSHLHRLLRKFTATSPKSLLSSKGQYRTTFTA